MELSEYARRRRAALLPFAAVPVLAGAAGAGWAAVQPAEYRHSVDIQVPASPGMTGAAALEQNVATYRSLVESSSVADTVARQTGVRAAVVRDGLSTQRPQLGTQRGSLVRVVYIGTNRTEAAEITRAAAVGAASELLRPTLESARQTLTSARASADTARQGLTDAAEKYGGLPTEEYRSLQNQIAQLEAERDAPSGNRSPADLRKAIAARKKRLAELAPRSIEVQALQDQLSQANRKLADAEETLSSAQAQLNAAQSSMTTGSPRAYAVDRNPEILRTAAASTGIGILLAAGLLALTSPRRPRPASPLPTTSPARIPATRSH